MRDFRIGTTRPRWALALVVGLTALAVASALSGHMGLLGQTGETLFRAMGAPWLRTPVSAAVFALLGMLALQAMVATSTYWTLDGREIRYRSNAVSADFLAYTWAVLRGREPEVDVRLSVSQVRRVRIAWEHQIVSLQLVAHGMLPMSVYPVTVTVDMADGTSASFTGLERDARTLGQALRALTALPQVELEDPDDLLAHMGEKDELYTYLDNLMRSAGRHEGGEHHE